MRSRFSILFVSIPFLFVVSSFVLKSSQTPWVAPDKAAKVPNPIKSDATSIADGKALWVKHCQSCHGKSGLGDGSKAAQLKTEPGNFSTADFQKQSDGSIFYKTAEGRDDMPSFKKKIPDQDELWSIVNYVRTLKK
jgi:mono/diheme cytochrome c family protein